MAFWNHSPRLQGSLEDPMQCTAWGLCDQAYFKMECNYLGKLFHDLTSRSLESWLDCGKSSPFMAEHWLVIFSNLPRIWVCLMGYNDDSDGEWWRIMENDGEWKL